MALGLYPTPAAHPFRRLAEAGCRVTINTDDPPYWPSTLAGEYAAMAGHQGCSKADLAAVTRTALEAAFVDEPTRTRLLARLAAAR